MTENKQNDDEVIVEDITQPKTTSPNTTQPSNSSNQNTLTKEINISQKPIVTDAYDRPWILDSITSSIFGYRTDPIHQKSQVDQITDSAISSNLLRLVSKLKYRNSLVALTWYAN